MKLSFRPTLVGAVLILSSLIIGISGLVRHELAALLWGGAFTLLGLYTFLGTLLATFGVRRNLSSSPLGALPFDGQSFPVGDALEAELGITLQGHRPPGIFLFIDINYLCGKRKLSFYGALEFRNTSIHLENPRRGRYLGGASVVCRDGLGFFQGRVEFPETSKLIIHPPLFHPPVIRHPPSVGGEGPATTRSFQRNDEHFDTRKYHPGDDPRRVHWKLYAHSEELFLRQGEEVPPPSGEYTIVIDLSCPGDGPTLLMEEFLDDYLGRFSAWARGLMNHGGTLILHEVGGKGPERWGPGQEEPLMTFLGALSYRPINSDITLDPLGVGVFYYLITPYGDGWRDRMGPLERGGRGSLIVSEVRPAPPVVPFRFGDLLFKGREAEYPRSDTLDLELRGARLLKALQGQPPRGGSLVL